MGGQVICLHDALSAFLVEISLAGRCVRASVEIDDSDQAEKTGIFVPSHEQPGSYGMENSADRLPCGFPSCGEGTWVPQVGEVLRRSLEQAAAFISNCESISTAILRALFWPSRFLA